MTETLPPLLKYAGIPAAMYRDLAYRTGALVALFLGVVVAIGPLNLLPGLSQALGFLLLPTIVTLILLYSSSLSSLLFTGRLARPLSLSLAILAVTLFVTYAAAFQTAFPALGSLTLPLLLTGCAWALRTTVAAISEAARIISSAALDLFTGFLALAAPAVLGLPDSAALGWILFTGSALAAATTLIGLVQGHSSEYVAYVGRFFSHGEIPWAFGALCVAILAYDRYIRPAIVAVASVGVSLFEWGFVIVVLISLGYRILGFVRSVSQTRKYSDLQSLVQRLAYDRGTLEPAHSAVERFVQGGQKEGLLVYVTSVLLENNVPQEQIEKTVSELVCYADVPEPTLALRWAAGDVARQNRERRLALVQRTVAATAEAIGQGFAAGPAGGREPSKIHDHSGGI